MSVTIIERPGRRPCSKCGGDVGAACDTCGGCGSIGPDLKCVCGRALERHGWQTDDPRGEFPEGRLPRYFCTEGHEVAIRFTTVDDEQKAAA
jgi:hypothetical protein